MARVQMARVQQCIGRRRTTAITLPAERHNKRPRRINRRRHNTRRRKATRTAMAVAAAAAARTAAAAQAQIRGRTTRRLGRLRTIAITLRRRTPVLRRTLRDVPGSAVTRPARITAPAGARIQAAELTRRAATAQLPRIRPAVTARWGRTLRRTTRLRITPAEAEAITRLAAEAAISAVVVVDTPAVADTGNFAEATQFRSGLRGLLLFSVRCERRNCDG